MVGDGDRRLQDPARPPPHLPAPLLPRFSVPASRKEEGAAGGETPLPCLPEASSRLFPSPLAKEGPAKRRNVSGASGSDSSFLQSKILFSPVVALSVNKGLFEQ